MKTDIVDTNCLMLLDKIDHLSLLTRTSDRVVTTDRVVFEFGREIQCVAGIYQYDTEQYDELQLQFSVGESSCIALALETSNTILIVDDKRARKVAEAKGIVCTGTLGLILLA